jgi:HSP20 family protein
MNVTQDPDAFFLRAELPGIDPKGLEITTLRNKIMISGERKLAEERGEVSYHRREREGGRFSRSLVLPTEIDAERVNASYEHGLLTLALPKAEVAKPKQIRVKTR